MCVRALIRNGMGLDVVFSFLYVSNFEACCWSFVGIKYCNITYVGAFVPDLYVVDVMF